MPDEKTMEALAEALDLPVAYFHATSDLLAEIILLMSRLSEDQQREILERARKLAKRE